MGNSETEQRFLFSFFFLLLSRPSSVEHKSCYPLFWGAYFHFYCIWNNRRK